MKIRGWNKCEPVHKPITKVVIDTQGGLQDILAIVVAHKIAQKNGNVPEIVGITCVAGKNSLDQAVSSALAVNHILGTKIPVYRGQSENLLLGTNYPKAYLQQNFSHAEQRVYEQVSKNKDLQSLVQEERASDFLIRISREHKENLGVIALGPTTNLGLAHRLEDCFNDIGHISLNGGQYMGVGTLQGGAEANFAHDPLAASILLEVRQGKDLRDILYTNPIQNTLSFNWKGIINSCMEFPPDQNPLHPLLDQIFQNMLSINSIVLQNGPLLTVLPVFNNKTVHKMCKVYAEIIRDGYEMDGLMAINWLKDGAKPGEYPNNVYVYTDLDQEAIEMTVKDAVLSKN